MKKINILIFIILILSTATARADVSSGLVAWWPFNEGQGYEANDLSGNGYNIWIDGPNWASATNGELTANGQTSLILNGTNPNLKTSASINYNGSTQVSISAWVYHNFTDGASTTLFSSGLSGASNAFTFKLEDTGGCGNMIGLYAGKNSCYTWPSNGWHHYVAIFNNTSGNTLYIDGQLQTATSQTSPGNNLIKGAFFNRPLYLMALIPTGSSDPASVTNAPVGQIADVRVYNRALSTNDNGINDIQVLYNLQAAPPNVLDAPQVALSAPASGASVSGRTVPLTATVVDNNASITAVQFQLNGNNIGSTMTSSPYTMFWDSTNVANGNYVLTVQAFNSLGQVTTATIPVTVSNAVIPAPSPTTAWPVVENVVNYGAKGDAVYMTADTVAGNTTITIDSNIDSHYTLSSADVGKVVELFQVGQATSSTTNMDLLTKVVSVNTTNNTAVLANAPGLTTKAARCLIGTQNAGAFQSAINAVVSGSPTIIYIPAGQYLLVSPALLAGTWTMTNESNLTNAVTINKAGISFVGENRERTILLGNGACELWPAPAGSSEAGQYFAQRGDPFAVYGPLSGSGPLQFSNLTFDGGVAQGLRYYQYWPATNTTGDGWDVTHDAIFEQGPQLTTQTITNCLFTHWRGEILKGGGSDKDYPIVVQNTSFIDGNADSYNFTYTHTINNDVFDDVVQPIEFWLGIVVYNGSAWVGDEQNDYFENSTISNASSGFALTGADTRDNTWNSNCAHPYNNSSLTGCGSYTITNDTIDVSGQAIYISPATRLTINNNRFLGGAMGILANPSGYQFIPPYGDNDHEILVENNYFENVGNPILLAGSSGTLTLGGTAYAYNAEISNLDFLHNITRGAGNNNYVAGGYGDGDTNDIFSNNYSDFFGLNSNNETGVPQWFYDDGTNDFVVNPTWQTPVSYLNSQYQGILSTGTFALDDTKPTDIPYNVVDYLNPSNPAGNATMAISNVTAVYNPNSPGPVSLYLSAAKTGTPVSIPVNEKMIVAWNGTQWVQSIGPEVPPNVTLTSPGSTITVPGTITLTATAGASGSVAKVDFYLNTNLVGTKTSSPYTITLSDVTSTSFVTSTNGTPENGSSLQNVYPGMYLVTAKVTDNLGMTTFSSPVWVTVNETSYPLTITTAGTGYGEVTGTDIDCGINNNECVIPSMVINSTVTLTAAASNGSSFAGWSGGGCSGTQTTCTVTMNQAQNVTATFNSGTSTSLNPGCVSADSSPTIYDAELTAEASVNIITLTSAQQQAAEVDGTGKLDIYDAFLIAEYAVDLITTFPVQQ